MNELFMLHAMESEGDLSTKRGKLAKLAKMLWLEDDYTNPEVITYCMNRCNIEYLFEEDIIQVNIFLKDMG